MADPTIIAHDTIISGRIEGDDDLTVQGHVDGTIDLSQTLTIGPQGRIDGDIRARQVILKGVLNGEITAVERVVLASTARAIANIEAPIVEMADGARLQGELNVGVDESTATTGTSSSPATRRSTTATSPGRASSTPSASTISSRQQPSRGTKAATSSATTTTVVEEASSDDAEQDADEDPLPEETIEQYHEDFTVKELREKLRNRDLRVSGTKDELIERLVVAESDTER